MKSQIVVRHEFLASHKWSGAPSHRAYLSNLHVHIFKFEARAPVSHSDRDIEFHDLRDALCKAVESVASYRIDGPPTFGEMSCEMIGEKILGIMPQLSSIIVSEDGQCDAEVTREASPRLTVITICGSTKFKKEYLEAQRRLEREGYITFSVGSFMHADKDEQVAETKDLLDVIHKYKIALSDAIYVVNPGGYIGDSTRSEIEHARSLGKTILSLEPLNF